MAVVDPYSPCPCGSGQKFKWCCQKVEAHAEKAQRLFESGQVEASLAALDEGLRKAPRNPWLSLRKAIVLVEQRKMAEAQALLESVLKEDPKHAGARGFLVRVLLETEGPAAAAAQLQQGLTACPPEARRALALPAQLIGMMFGELGDAAAALAHLRLVEVLVGIEEGEDDPTLAGSIRSIEANASYSPWVRNPYELGTPPEGLDDAARGRFEEARARAEQGLFSSAAAAFEALGADREAGLCRLWLGDDRGAIAALRRQVARLGPTAEAVDLEALCQVSAPVTGADVVERVHWIWPVRDRGKLLEALGGDRRFVAQGRAPMDPDDPGSFEVDAFGMLDRPRPESFAGIGAADVPRLRAQVLVGQEIVVLEGFDDGRLDALAERLRDLAGPAIPPAHHRTKILDRASRSALALQIDWWLPPEADRDELNLLARQERARLIRDVWPETPQPYLANRTPLQAARAGDAEVPLRAAICQFEFSHEFFRDAIDFAALRARLDVPEEPAIDPEAVDLERLHIGRLHRVPADRLDDPRLVLMLQIGFRFVLPLAMERAARTLTERPGALDGSGLDRVSVFGALANLALSRQDRDEAFAWLERGRRSEPPETRARNAVRWDMLEVRLRGRSEPPEQWVPLLAAVLERHQADSEASSSILSDLVGMGLVQLAPHPERPEEMILDSRALQAMLARYGPRITTATGRLGVAAAQPGIWTPGQDAGAPAGSLWTPGGAPGPAAGEKSKLIIPGR